MHTHSILAKMWGTVGPCTGNWSTPLVYTEWERDRERGREADRYDSAYEYADGYSRLGTRVRLVRVRFMGFQFSSVRFGWVCLGLLYL